MDEHFDLSPTKKELKEQAAEPELSWDEALRQKYRELARDKRGELDTPCLTWDQHGCHCDHQGGGLRPCPNHSLQPTPDRSATVHVGGAHSGPAHASKEGRPWCPVHQQACDEAHPFISEDQFVRRFQPPTE